MNQYIDQLYSMRMNPNPVSGKKSPHKAVMMLAVMDLIASGGADGNFIEYGPELLEGFRSYFDVVKRAYHYQCAACGLRIYFDDVSLVDAAHIIPFSVSHDDDPRNGMALCKNHHWAMDQELIAPCSNYKWKAHPELNERYDSHRHLIGLDGKKIILPEEQRFIPKIKSLR